MLQIRLSGTIANAGILQLCDSRAAVQWPSTAGRPSSICHDIVIKPTDDVRTFSIICYRWGIRMAGKMLSVEPTIDPPRPCTTQGSAPIARSARARSCMK